MDGGVRRRRRGGGKGGRGVAYHVIDGPKCAPRVERAVLEDVAGSCVLDGGVADVADGEEDRVVEDAAEVVREAEDGPVVADG